MFYAKVRAKAQLPRLRDMFGSYKGRTVVLTEGESAHIHDYWDEGNRAYPQLFDVATLRPVPWESGTFEQQAMPYVGMRAGNLRLTPGIGLAEHVYSGIRQYLRVTLHPADDRSTWI